MILNLKTINTTIKLNRYKKRKIIIYCDFQFLHLKKQFSTPIYIYLWYNVLIYLLGKYKNIRALCIKFLILFYRNREWNQDLNISTKSIKWSKVSFSIHRRSSKINIYFWILTNSIQKKVNSHKNKTNKQTSKLKYLLPLEYTMHLFLTMKK